MSDGRAEAALRRPGLGRALRHPWVAEFVRDQAALVAGTLLFAIAVSHFQYGFVPDAERPFPIAGVAVSVTHLVVMGAATGYLMALVGQANGIASLVYCMSVLQFNGVNLSPTSLVTTLLNPFGAVLGFWRARQWNLDLALPLCLGAVVGAPLGPFVRVFLLADPAPFKALTGAVLLLLSLQLWWERRGPRAVPAAATGEVGIATRHRSWRAIVIAYRGGEVSLSVPALVAIGAMTGVAGAALGIGGGFLLVPILVVWYRLPLYVVVAASIPYVIVLSLMGLLGYVVTLPWLTGVSHPPDWAFGLFVASGAIVGAWLGAKTQRLIPENRLKSLLGLLTGPVGALYVINYFWPLPIPL